MSKKEGVRKASETAAQAEEGVCKQTGIPPALLEGLFDKERLTIRNIADTESPETSKRKESRQLQAERLGSGVDSKVIPQLDQSHSYAPPQCPSLESLVSDCLV